MWSLVVRAPRLALLILTGAAGCVDLAVPEPLRVRVEIPGDDAASAEPEGGAAGADAAPAEQDGGLPAERRPEPTVDAAPPTPTVDGARRDAAAPSTAADAPGTDRPADASRDLANPPPDARLMPAGLVHHWRLDEGRGTTAEDHVGGNDGRLTAGASWTASVPARLAAPGAAALALDGTGHVTIETDLADILGRTSSLSYWIHTTQPGADPSWNAPLLVGADELNGENDIFWGFIEATGRVGVQSGTDRRCTNGSPINDGIWHHVVMTRDENTGRLEVFVDGRPPAGVTGPKGTKGIALTRLGRNSGGNAPPLKGWIDDVRIYNRVLSLTEVQALFAGP